MPDKRGGEPAAAARAAGHDAELAPALAEQRARRIGELGRERAGADAGGVRLGDPEDRSDRGGAEAGAGGGRRRDRVAAGDEGIGAVIDVEHHRLRAFEEDAGPRPPRLVQTLPYRLRVRQDARCKRH